MTEEYTLQEIGDTLAFIASHYPDEPQHVPGKKSISVAAFEMKFGTLTIRCLPFRERIMKVADKYRAPTWRWTRTHENDLPPRPPTLRRPKNADALLKELEDGQ